MCNKLHKKDNYQKVIFQSYLQFQNYQPEVKNFISIFLLALWQNDTIKMYCSLVEHDIKCLKIVEDKIKTVELLKKMWYNLHVVLPIPGNRRRCSHGVRYNFFSRCCGWCSLPLHHQMVGQ